VDTFAEALALRGFAEGRHAIFDRRYADGDAGSFSNLATEALKLSPDVIISTNPPSTMAAVAATKTIPIVFVAVVSPVELGLVESLARPGRNVTGLSYDASPETMGKLFELLKEIVPTARRIAVLRPPTALGSEGVRLYGNALETAGRDLSLEVVFVEAANPPKVEQALSKIANAHVDAVNVGASSATFSRLPQILEFLRRSRLPSVSNTSALARAGLLLTYGANVPDIYRRAATYVEKLLTGARPADLPVEQPTKYDFALNVKTAKTLGLAIPKSLLVRADEVIQ
jgi:putative ABC transport system substrate-binding protein